MTMTAMENKVYEGLTVFQRAKIKFGVSHPAEQILMLLDRVEKLEALVKAMLEPTKETPRLETSADGAGNIVTQEPVKKLTPAERMAKARAARRKKDA